MVLKRLFIAVSLSFILALQGWGQVASKHDTILANYEQVQEFQEFTLGVNYLIIVYRFIRGKLTIQIISGLNFKRQQVKITIM